MMPKYVKLLKSYVLEKFKNIILLESFCRKLLSEDGI
jgi:hypothetical protein